MTPNVLKFIQMKKFHNLSEFLKTFREHNTLTQTDLENILNIDIRTISRWESNRNPVSYENEYIIAEKLGIPFQVVHNLNAQIPILYNLKTRRYSISEFNTQIISPENKFNLSNIKYDRISVISNLRDVNKILEYDHSIYHTDLPIKQEIILKSASILPNLNFIVKDYLGFYSGHLVTLPLKREIFQKLKTSEIIEGELKINDLTNDSAKISIYYIYSVYANCSDNAIYLLNAAKKYFRNLENSDDIIISGYAVTKDGKEIAEKLGLGLVYENYEEFKEFNTEAVPALYEGKIKDLRILTALKQS